MLSVKNKWFRYFSFAKSILLIVLITLLIPINSWASTIEQEYTFNEPTVDKVKIDNILYDRINMPGAPNSGTIGHPAQPSFGVRILLPYGTEISSISVKTGEKIPLGTDYSIEPVETPLILSSDPGDLPPVVKDDAIYSMNSAYPENKFNKTGVQCYRGYQILLLTLSPVEYIPSSGSLYYYTDMTVHVTTKPSNKPFSPLRMVPADETEAKKWIDNPLELNNYNMAGKVGREEYDMLIITLTDWVIAFQPLKDYHDSTEVSTEIHTLDMIGASDPHSVRDYIRQEYLDNGIQYVLIGADDDFIPALDMYVKSWESPTAVYEYDMPGDIYFSCLDGTYNYDGDALWGEPTDGEGGGDIDLLPEINLGRFTAGSISEINNMVAKTLTYAASTSPYLEKVLISGEKLGFAGLGEYGGYAMDEMVNYSDAHGFLTFAYPDDVYQIDKLYDILSMPYNYWDPSEMIAYINSSVHIIDHLGHSGPGYAMRTDTAMIRNQLTNTEFCFIYSEGCSAGRFDIKDCWAEYVTSKLPTGAFGCIANSRLGLGSRSTRHPVHVFNREFWDAVYNAEEASPQLGRAFSESRIDHAYHINDPAIRWNYYEINLFGDPALAFKSVQSVAISYPDGTPEKILPYTETAFNVLATGIGTGDPVSGTGQLHYSINGAAYEIVDMTETSTNLYEAVLPSMGCDKTIDYYVSVEESKGQVYYSPNPATPYSLSPISDSTILFEDNFETDMGWTVSGGLWARGIPTGQGGEELQYPAPDPTEGCNGPNVFGYNLNGDYENNLPQTYIISPEIDCEGTDNVHLKFCRWLAVEEPVYDQVKVLASSDAVNWTAVWSNYAVIADLEWQAVEYDISTIAADQKTVYVAWTMGPTDGGLVYAGWNIDDVRLLSYTCLGIICGDASGDDLVNILDITFLINYLYKGGPPPDPMEAADVNGDTTVNILDITYLIAYLYQQGPGLNCP